MGSRSDSNITVNSFFAGIGGFDLGLERTGMSVKFQCEINKFCRRVLERHWPSIPTHSDITSLQANDIPDSDVWCGGFPCQDVSVARGWLGRDGLKGKNSGLFHPFHNLITQKKPTVVLFENVLGLLSSHKGSDFFLILKLMTEAGYGVAWRVMNTRYYGAPQSRPRVYIAAWLGRPDLATRCLYEEEVAGLPESPRLGFLRENQNVRAKAVVPEVAYCLAATSGRHTGTDWSRSYVSYWSDVRRLTPRECEGLQGFPFDWSYPSDDFHLTNDEIDTLRYHALGNAVSVPVIEWIGNNLSEAFRDKKSRLPRNFSVSKDTLPDFRSGGYRTQDLGIEPDSDHPIKWRSGGVAYHGSVLDVKVSAAPCKPVSSHFGDLVETGAVERKYFLSPNAARGIIRRVDSQGRTLFRPMRKALERLAQSDQADLFSTETEVDADEVAI